MTRSEPGKNADAPLAVIAIGGNSLIKDREHMDVLDQYRAAGETSHHIVAIVKQGYRVLVTHGNGPQVGFILLRSEMARDVIHEVPLANCVADTQGSIGLQIAQSLQNEFLRQGVDQPVVALVTQTVVDERDPSFSKPSKPIGPFMSEEEARQHEREDGWVVGEEAGRGWRRLVASPTPLKIIELPAIRALLAGGTVVIAAGGGGVPVVYKPDGTLRPRPAVIDKDAASCLLACELGASVFVISTDVDKVALNFGTPEQVDIDHMNVAECRRYLEEGHFAAGSMRPKIESALRFLENGGKEVIITQPHHLEGALQGISGTHIVP
ncbi:MAG: carbamate kinase [Gammaproteobacteria bacterium]|nr:carbamate kinase [Gammaproteobacteria bacterium]MDH3578497.1 carbamate kinase [Gammaproteobacteria bacterium]